ncbi:MAG: chloride channel protein, partial [Planctomycetes bacterium]|nr:chloride channel protein [Planctomycetota bacterium]
LLGVAFLNGIAWLQSLFMGSRGSTINNAALALDDWHRVLIPTIGGLLAGLCIMAIRNQRGPFGITDVIELVATRRGEIRLPKSLVQILSSGLTIASGGSIGREGANSQFGATVASLIGRMFHESSRTRTILLGAGIAAGMAAAYKAPIAAAIFVMEVVLGNFAMDVMAPIVVASVVSTLVTRAFVDYEPIYYRGAIQLEDWHLVLSAIALGAACGVGGVVFRRCLEFGRVAFQSTRLPFPLRMALGGALVGLIGVWLPQVWGNGQATIDIIADLEHMPALTFVAGLVVFKVLATAITAGSGGLGGVFTPNLVVGAALGAAFANVVGLFEDIGSEKRVAFALVGMAGMCAATTHAPITAIMLLFELTGDYDLILPLMLCSIVGSVTARLIDPESIYTAQLKERGHKLHSGIEELAIHNTFVRDIQRADPVAIDHHTRFDEVLQSFRETRRGTIYVVDGERRLLGQIQLHDVKYYINDETLGSVVIAADLTRPIPHTVESESLAAIIDRFDDPDLDELPVVESHDNPRLVGRITRRDLVTCLSEEVLGKRQLRAKLKSPDSKEADYVELPRDSALKPVTIPDSLAGRSLDSLDLVAERGITPIVYIRVDANGYEQRILPRPELVLETGDRMVLLGAPRELDRLRDDLGLDAPH